MKHQGLPALPKAGDILYGEIHVTSEHGARWVMENCQIHGTVHVERTGEVYVVDGWRVIDRNTPFARMSR